ncbi:MAG TPA: hypothetical protein VGK53_22660 [Propionicimonas sp.]
MLKPYVVVAAALSAFVVPAMGAQLAVAAQPSTGLHAPAVKPNATPSPLPSPSTSADDMVGMNHEGMPEGEHEETTGMNHEGMPEAAHDETGGMNDETMPGMDHDQTSGMNDEDMPGMNHGETPGSHEEPSPGSSASPAAEEGAESHDAHGEETVTEPRPVAALVGAFAVVNGGVMISAALLRRRDKHGANASLKPARPAK